MLVRLGEGRTGWYLNQHHLVTDAWSTLLLYREVGAEYEALLGGDGAERSPLSAYYPTVATLQPRAAQRTKALEHWASRQQRRGRSVPLYGRSTDPVGTASTRLTLELDEDRSRALDRLSRQEGFLSLSEGLSRFALFATLLVSWLHRVSGRSDLGFDAPVAGRPTPEAKRALGLFIEMFPFAATVEPHDTFRSLGATVPGGGQALPAPRPPRHELPLRRHRQQHRAQLLSGLVRHLRRRPGRGGLGSPRSR